MTSKTVTNFFDMIASCFWRSPSEESASPPPLCEMIRTFQKELTKQQMEATVHEPEVENLAKRWNTIVIQATESTPSNPLSKKTLCKIHEISKLILVSNPVNRILWKNLEERVQQFVRSLHPHFLPPIAEADIVLRTSSASRFQAGDVGIVRCGDEHQFQVRFIKAERSTLHFAIEGEENTWLKVASSLKPNIGSLVHPFISHLPYGIGKFFHTDDLVSKIEEFSHRRHIAAQIVPQLTHQLFIAKQLYLNRVLQAAGVKIPCPKDYSFQCEWVIDRQSSTEGLNEFLDRTGSADLVADQIAQFLILEKTMGIYILGDSESSWDHKLTSAFEMEGENVYCALPRKKIEFLDGPFEERMETVCNYISLSYPQLEQSIPRIKEAVEQARSPSTAIDILKEGFSNHFLRVDDPLNHEIATVCLQLTPLPFLKPFSWNRFRSPNEFLLYCSLHLAINENREPLVNELRNLYRKCKELLLNIPDKGKPHPLLIGTDFSQVVERDLELRKEIRLSSIKEILRRFKEMPELSLYSHIEKVVHSINVQLNKDDDLKDVSLMKYSTVGEFFGGIFWNGFAEELNSWAFPKKCCPSMQTKLALTAALPTSPEQRQMNLEVILFKNFVEFRENQESTAVKKRPI